VGLDVNLRVVELLGMYAIYIIKMISPMTKKKSFILQNLHTASTNPMANLTAGTTYYTWVTLYVYDFWVLYISNSFAWRCSTRNILLPFFKSHVGRQHLDVGVGTGYYPARAAGNTPMEALTLVDLNPNCLSMASRRIQFPRPKKNGTSTIVADALQPGILPSRSLKSFDSISLMYLIHTLPAGPRGNKNKLQQISCNVKPYLKEGGVVLVLLFLERVFIIIFLRRC
jgi:SAM-dependent methyltransferase